MRLSLLAAGTRQHQGARDNGKRYGEHEFHFISFSCLVVCFYHWKQRTERLNS
jgi:hypothetical protein